MARKRLTAYLPDVLRDVRELKAAAQAEQPEVDELVTAIERVHLNQFAIEADEYGISRWESMLRIIPKSGQSLDDRRNAVLLRLMERLPYTMRVLRRILGSICGEDGYSVELFPNDYTISVNVGTDSQSLYETVRETLARILPANLVILATMVCAAKIAVMCYTAVSEYKQEVI